MAGYQPAAGPSRSYNNIELDSAPSSAAGSRSASGAFTYSRSSSSALSPNYSPSIDGGEWGQSDHLGMRSNPTPNGMTSPSLSMPEPRVTKNDSVLSNDDGAKRNPLVDLIDTERVYVDQLGLVIRRVAAAWSRKDFPPPKLDAMFRCVETVYRANRAFGVRLKEIGPNPSSPKALGDLLMRWIDDLEPSYHRYSVIYMSGFDSYPPVINNNLLPDILSEISSTSPPPPPLEHWTLDALFLLPYTRLRYYRKLYARLLRSTKEGRSDHRLLLTANQRLENLVTHVEARLEVDVVEEESLPPSGEQSREQSWALDKERISRTSSAMDSSIESHTNRVEESRNSGGSAATSMTQSPQRQPFINTAQPISPGPVSPPLADLELRIDTERTLDLFTMNPKRCKLQMNPSSLPFTRSLRSSHDVTIYFSPTSTGTQVIHRRAHVFILSDLFLVADRMEASEKAEKAQQVARDQPERVGEGGPMPEMWLAYPPLAGKHLAATEGQQVNVVMVTVMRKETFIIHAESEMERDQILKNLVECIEFATSVSRKNTSAMPSPICPDPRSPSAYSDAKSTESSTFPPLRYPSPFSPASSPSNSPRPLDVSEMPPNPLAGPALASQMGKLALEPGESITWPRGPTPPPPPPPPPPPSSSSSSSVPKVVPFGVGMGPPPVPGGPAPMAVLPPRGASLARNRQASVPGGSLSPTNTMPPPSSFLMQPLVSNSEPILKGSGISRSTSGRSIASQGRSIAMDHSLPPVPQIRTGPSSNLSDTGHGSHSMPHLPPPRSRSAEPLCPPEPPSARFSSFPTSGVSPAGSMMGVTPHEDDSPPMSPVEEESTTLSGPVVISAQMKCKVFLQQGHQQWKSLGNGKLKLYVEKSRNVKQLVVESEGGILGGKGSMLISTIVLTDGVERVAKTGVAVEISDRGKRTGIIYMIQLRNENSAQGLFESLLAGSDRAIR